MITLAICEFGVNGGKVSSKFIISNTLLGFGGNALTKRWGEHPYRCA